MVLPAIAPGAGGAEPAVTESVLALETSPHALVAVTEIVPPAAPVMAVILGVVEVPVHPPGNVQV